MAFYRGADICILCYDVTDPRSFNNLEIWYADFLKQAQPVEPNTFPFVLVGNKIDLADQRLISTQFASDWCLNKKNMSYFETSVKEGLNVNEAFKDGTVRALIREKQHKSMFDDIPNHIKINNTENEHDSNHPIHLSKPINYSLCNFC